MKGQEPKPSPMRTSFLEHYFKQEHNQVVSELESLGFRSIMPYHTDHWYIGDDGTDTRRKYYSAYFNGKRCFIKYVANDSTIANEIFVNHYLTENRIPYVPQTLYASYSKADNTAVLATEWLENISGFFIPENIETFRAFLADYLDILHIFEEKEITHNDVSDSNLIVINGEKLMLTDFGIGHVPGSDQFYIDYILHDGTYYQQQNRKRIYDDAWSFYKILEDAGIPETFKQTKEYRNLLAQIGKHTYVITFPLPTSE